MALPLSPRIRLPWWFPPLSQDIDERRRRGRRGIRRGGRERRAPPIRGPDHDVVRFLFRDSPLGPAAVLTHVELSDSDAHFAEAHAQRLELLIENALHT